MSLKTKFLIALVVALVSISAVTVLANTIYFPQMIKSPTITPTATATNTPVVTPTPTRTPTPTPGINIVTIDYDPPNALDEYIEIENTSNSSVDMDGWWIKEDTDGYRYDFPANYTLGGDKSVKVWTRTGNNTSSNLYMGRSEPFWSDNQDTAYLRDDNGDLVASYDYHSR